MANYIDKIKKGETTYNIKQASYTADSSMDDLSSDFVAALKLGDTIMDSDSMQIYTVTYDDESGQKTLTYIDEAMIECIVYMHNEEGWYCDDSSYFHVSLTTLRNVIDFSTGITAVPVDILESVRVGDMLISNDDDYKLFVCSFKSDNHVSFTSLPDAVDANSTELVVYQKLNNTWSLKSDTHNNPIYLYKHEIKLNGSLVLQIISLESQAFTFADASGSNVTYINLNRDKIISAFGVNGTTHYVLSFGALSNGYIPQALNMNGESIDFLGSSHASSLTDTVNNL